LSNERNTNTQGVLAILSIIGIPFANAQSISSLENGNHSPHIPSLGFRLGNSSTIHNQSYIFTSLLYSTPVLDSNPSSKRIAGNTLAKSSSDKVVMINFDDGYKSQVMYAKPILDRYGFKASFFIVCGRVETQPYWMNWKDIAELKKDGMDIESHTMTHAHLNKLSTNALNYEIRGSKQCFAIHGYNTTIFGYPFNLGSDKPLVVNLVAKYYNIGRSGTDRLMFLDCKGYVKDMQTDCRTHSPNGKLTHANRYDIRSASFYHVNTKHNFSPQEMFQVFLQIVNGQIPYILNGKINAIPIIVYHNLTNKQEDYTTHATSTTVDLFAQEMKYLHNNGFKVLLLNQLGFNSIDNVFYLTRAVSSIHSTTN
jgi:hypothetical protein